jgi:hypothetical protein
VEHTQLLAVIILLNLQGRKNGKLLSHTAKYSVEAATNLNSKQKPARFKNKMTLPALLKQHRTIYCNTHAVCFQ